MQNFIKECRENVHDINSDVNLDIYEVSDNRFALCDIDGDGQNELITELVTTFTTAGAVTSVYGVNGRCRAGFYPEPRFYDNGVVWEPWSHNQGPATAIWPFYLYKYYPSVKRYEKVGTARAWSRRVEGFPAEADLDGDGMVYFINGSDDPADNAVYDAWWDFHMNGARILPVFYFPLTEDIIDSLSNTEADR